jgi:hypothetical protein
MVEKRLNIYGYSGPRWGPAFTIRTIPIHRLRSHIVGLGLKKSGSASGYPEDKLDVTAVNFGAPVLSATVVCGIDEHDHKRGKILRQR